MNVDAILNTKHNYKIKKGARISDSLPGIINRFGLQFNDSIDLLRDRVRGEQKWEIQVNELKSSELKEL